MNLPLECAPLQAPLQFWPSGPWSNLTVLHASGAIGEGQFPKSVGDPQRRDRLHGVFAKPLHGGQHRCLAAGIEQGGRFIQQQEPGVTGQGSGNGQALFLAAAEAVDWPLLQLGEALSLIHI